MRRAMHILSLAAVLVGLILWQRPALERLIERVRTETRRLSVAENTVPNIAYVLNDRNWTAFSLSGVGGTVRIVSNASVAETEPPSVPETEWHYALSYQLLDAGNQVLREGSYHHYTTLTPLVADSDDDARDRAPLYNARYLNLPFQPADSRLIRLNIAGTPGADKLRLRIETMDPAIRDVVARVFMRRKYSEQRIPYWWARTRADKRAKLAEGNVYPPDLLRQQERANILRNLWHALGPAGIEGIDYARRDLYILNDIDTSEADKPSEPPAGVWITEKLLGVVPIPEGLTLVRVTFLDCDDPARPQPSGFVLRWYGKGLQKRTSYSVSWTGSGTQWEQALEGGLLEIEVQGEGDPDRTPC
ncbi:MAG: hypothetical protein QG656_286, partial [Candidatus Hydrogenedentes bacterium]|nr:hypothetical protein [Candidatus Hydrogenedentota bacterium]